MTDTKKPEDIEISPTLEDIATHLRYVRRDVSKIDKQLDRDYVKKAEFTPVRNLVYGFTALLLTGVIVAIVNHILVNG